MKADRFSAILDANVLYPAPTRNLLLRVAGKGAYRARWTNQIHDEWINALLRNRPDLSRARRDRTRESHEREHARLPGGELRGIGAEP